ncbi:2-phospho-L-lactate guanylyltransferase [Amnibacterium setariae]|uniref:2-phospho-L-lactate guanylyltransferase n=1 Tax=Amnibacterium setariae TaxID=2306585 RepID=UPI0013149E26|nr:2-phospho-L-lactate guanylyltransferase [Amnibacterium setariae]
MIDWVVIVPIKRFSEGKRRLGDRPDRAALAEAFARDTLDAVAAAPHVRMLLVTTDDPHLVDDLSLPVAVTVVTQGAPGLNNAIAAGLRVANDRWPDWGQAVLAGDLPALQPEDLERTFEIAEEIPLGVVADAQSTGTVMLTGQPGVPLLPAFGVGSASRHRDLGHRLIRGTERLRRDVDTIDDLAAAIRLGVGEHTRAVLDASGIGLEASAGAVATPVRGIGQSRYIGRDRRGPAGR